MFKIINRKHQLLRHRFFVNFLLFTICTGCYDNPGQPHRFQKEFKLNPPEIIKGKAPVSILPDTCCPAGKIVVPVKPGAFIAGKPDTGQKRNKAVSPEKKPAELFAPMQNLNTGTVIVPDSVYSIYEDKNGSLWFGTAGAGVSRYDGKTFTNYTHEQGLVHNFVREIAEDTKGNLWIATDSGISRFNLSKSLRRDVIGVTNFTTAQGLACNSVRCILEDDNGNVWFGTFGGGCSRYDGKTFLKITAADGLADDDVYDMVKDNKGNIWFGTHKGITVLKGFCRQINYTNTSGKTRTTLKQRKLSNDEIIKGGYRPVVEIYHISAVSPTSDITGSSLFMSAKNILMEGEAKNIIHFNYDSVHMAHAPPRVFIQELKVNNEKISWKNLLISPPDNKQLSPRNNRTDRGNMEEATLFGKPLSDEQFENIRKKFSDIKFDSITLRYAVPVNLVLPYHHNNLTFEFATMETARPGLVNYQYVLEGYSDEWSPPSNEKSASFGNIPEGNYAFRLRAQNPEGAWSAPLVYTFKVLPPWHRTWSAYSLYLLVTGILLWCFVRWRLRILEKEKLILEDKVAIRTYELQNEKEKVESTLAKLEATQEQLIEAEKIAFVGKMEQAVSNERMRISRELHDEVGATLSSISIFSQAAIQKNESGNMADSKVILERIGETSREVMGELNDTVWLINPCNDTLQKIIQRINNYALPLCTTNNIQLEITAAASLEDLDLGMEKRKAVYLIIKEAVNNSLKYAGAKNMFISFEENDRALHVYIKDDGTGFAENNSPAGNGLKNMKQRAKDMNGMIEFNSVPEKGTEIILRVPLTNIGD